MGLEKERKFILKYIPTDFIERLVDDRKATFKWIEQGYLVLEKEAHLRVRIVRQSGHDPKGILCYKKILNETTRQEFEYEIPIKEAQEMMQSCTRKFYKQRISFAYNGNQVDIDIYHELPTILEIAEIEYVGELEDKDIPDFCGEEVTGVYEFTNIALAQMK